MKKTAIIIVLLIAYTISNGQQRVDFKKLIDNDLISEFELNEDSIYTIDTLFLKFVSPEDSMIFNTSYVYFDFWGGYQDWYIYEDMNFVSAHKKKSYSIQSSYIVDSLDSISWGFGQPEKYYRIVYSEGTWKYFKRKRILRLTESKHYFNNIDNERQLYKDEQWLETGVYFYKLISLTEERVVLVLKKTKKPKF